MEGGWTVGEVSASMYTKQEASRIRQQFWTSFGQYMRPIAGVSGETVNWLNYKTGIKDIYFRMDADADRSIIAIELQQRDPELRKYFFQRLESLKRLFHVELQEQWEWFEDLIDETGRPISCVRTILQPANIFLEKDWPKIISFFKPRLIGLDRFWDDARSQFEN